MNLIFYYYYFDLSKDVDNYLKHEVNIVIKYNEFLVDRTIKNDISHLLSRYNHENNIHEYGKQ